MSIELDEPEIYVVQVFLKKRSVDAIEAEIALDPEFRDEGVDHRVRHVIDDYAWQMRRKHDPAVRAGGGAS